MKRIWKACVLVLLASLAATAGCVVDQGMTGRGQEVAPQPILGNSGAYMSPYTRAGQLTDWARSGIQDRTSRPIMTQQVFGAQQASGSLPSGTIVGTKKSAGMDTPLAIESSGGMDFIREKSDLSFRSAGELCTYLTTTCSAYESFDKVLQLTRSIYPELKRCR